MSLHVAVSGWLLGPPSGANRRLLALLKELAPRLATGERITVLHGPAFAPPPPGDGIHWRQVPIAAGPALRRALGERRHLPRTLRDLRADLLDHGLLPAPRVPCALVQTIHDVRWLAGLGARPRWLMLRALRAGCRRARAVIAPSAFTAAQLAAIARDARIEVVANGVDLPAPPTEVPGAGGHLLHVGHLERRKNLAVLLAALALLPAPDRPRLLLAGADAGAGRRLRRLARSLGVADRVDWPGRVAEADLPRLYAAARAVVVPSLHEGFGLCALEGLAHGRPVLAADAAALPEVVGDQAVLLPPGDPAAWAAAIAATAADPPTAPAARRARAARFPWAAAAGRVLALWRELAGSLR